MNTKYWIVNGLNILSSALNHASRFIKYNASPPRGIYLKRAKFGHTVSVDGFCLPYELSWGEAEELRKHLECFESRRAPE